MRKQLGSEACVLKGRDGENEVEGKMEGFGKGNLGVGG